MKKIIIIGAGVAGLSAGILAQGSGFETEIYEAHSLPGGLCTSWKRGGYTFDGCIRYVYGSGEGMFCNPIMKRIGAAGGLKYIHHNESNRIETSAGPTVVFHCDLGKLQSHLLEISPEDGGQIKMLIKAARSISRAPMPATGVASLAEFGHMMRALPRYIPLLIRLGKTTLGDFASSFKSPALSEAFVKYYAYADLSRLPLFFLIIDLAQHHAKNAGWPAGGSLAFAHALEQKYLSLGGKILYKAPVTRILTEGGRAVGIRLAEGGERSADYVVSAADAHTVLNTLLDGKFTPPEYVAAFRNERTIAPLVQVSLGIDGDLSGLPHSIVFSLKDPVKVAGICYGHLAFKHYCYDGAMAPRGKSAAVVIFETEYEPWAELARDRARYDEEKQKAATQVIGRLEARFPGLGGTVEVVDVATPMTYVRYTGNYKASAQGWQTAPGHIGNLPGKLPGLQNFYMIGQWVQRGGGLPGGAISAYNAIKQICKECKISFR